MARDSHDQPRCERCSKPTSRLLGVGAKVQLREPHRIMVRVAALGYCLEHKADVVPDWLAALGLDGIPELISDHLVDLRPRDAEAFVQTMQASLADQLGGFETIDPADGAPTTCTHCGGSLAWGEGPHAGVDRVLVKAAFAWECSSCRAAGLLMRT